ncbi:MAG: methyltransferase domain-containing protein [bacterium]|nr:methyltransferase domain-containing protein [bacterium]
MKEAKWNASPIKVVRKMLRPLKVAFTNLLFNARNVFFRSVRPPKLPRNHDERLLIHLGCGEQDDPRYVNVDAVAYPHVHYIAKVDTLPMFASGSADLVYACHVLEHIEYPKMERVLTEWYRVLKPGGIVRISVPEFEKIVAIYKAEGMERALPPLMGAEDATHGFHRTAFSEEYLSTLLKRVGFRETRRWDPEKAADYAFNDWAKKLVHGKFPISLNMEGIK